MTVDSFLQQQRGGTEPDTSDSEVTVPTDEGTATFETLEGPGPVTQSGLLAVKAPAAKLQDVYTVEKPLQALEAADYTVVNRSPS